MACGHIVAELLVNAGKHAFPNNRTGTVHIFLRRCEDSMIELAVEDDGVGMPKNFDPRQTETLGLQLVNGYAKKLGGEFIIDGEGHTCARVVFPEELK